MKLSVVMPVYNEQATLQRVVERVMSVGLEVELLCVDDGSTDNSREILSNLQNQWPNMRVFLQSRNMGYESMCNRPAILTSLKKGLTPALPKFWEHRCPLFPNHCSVEEWH